MLQVDKSFFVLDQCRPMQPALPGRPASAGPPGGLRSFAGQGNRSLEREERPDFRRELHLAGAFALQRRDRCADSRHRGNSRTVAVQRRQSGDGTGAALPEHLRHVAELLESAREELATSQPERYKILLLGVMAGLRRNEIDVLPWSAFRWNEGVIRIETTELYRPKSHNSEGDVRVDPELMELFPRLPRAAQRRLRH